MHTRIDPQISFHWGSDTVGPTSQYENVSARWTGKLQSPTTDLYTFELWADDDSRLWIDGVLQ